MTHNITAEYHSIMSVNNNVSQYDCRVLPNNQAKLRVAQKRPIRMFFFTISHATKLSKIKSKFKFCSSMRFTKKIRLFSKTGL